MRLIGLTICRNEEWIIGLTARAALEWVDELVVLDHASSDGTPDILRTIAHEHSGRLRLLHVRQDRWQEMEHRQRTLDMGRRLGGTHFAICDADELLTGNLIEHMRGWLADLAPGQLLQLPMLAMWRGLRTYRDDLSPWSHAKLSLVFRNVPSAIWKPAPDGYQFHSRAPRHAEKPIAALRPLDDKRKGGVMHLQWIAWSRLAAKQAHYKMLETVMWPGRRPPAEVDRKYSQAFDETAIKVSRVKPEWWQRWRPLQQHMNLRAPDWHRAECKRLWKEHDPETFKGLDLWGVV